MTEYTIQKAGVKKCRIAVHSLYRKKRGIILLNLIPFILKQSNGRPVSVFNVFMIRGVFCIQIIRAAGVLIYNRDIIVCRNCTD